MSMFGFFRLVLGFFITGLCCRVVFAVGEVLAAEGDSRSSYIKTRQNKRLLGHVVKKIDFTDEMSCSQACLRHSRCTSSNFKESLGNCELNKHEFFPTDHDTKLTDNPGTTFSLFLKGCLMTGCLNGGSCLFDEGKDTFACSCSQQWSGEKCEMEVPRPVACFRGADNLEEELGDFRSEIKLGTDPYDVVEKCAVLARAKQYKMFALGKDGLCLSGADTQNKYHINGPANGADCKDGIGKGNSMFVYSLDSLPDLKSLGCYKENSGDRALPNNYANFRRQINWKQLETVQQCAQVAFNKGYEYFAVQFYGECYTGNDASQTYDKHGGSDKCVEIGKTLGFRVGQKGTNFVYRIN